VGVVAAVADDRRMSEDDGRPAARRGSEGGASATGRR
jgi:hypothetical protein